MNRNDIFRTSANGIDPYGGTARSFNRQHDRWHSRGMEEDRPLEPHDGYLHDPPRDHQRDSGHGFWSRDYDRPGFRGMDERTDFWGYPRHMTHEQQQFRHDVHPSMWERVKGAFSGKGPKNWTRSDERIREDVCERLAYHHDVDASDIEVMVKESEVTLSGFVTDRQSKRLAEDIADNVSGVKDVHNQLRVKAR